MKHFQRAAIALFFLFLIGCGGSGGTNVVIDNSNTSDGSDGTGGNSNTSSESTTNETPTKDFIIIDVVDGSDATFYKVTESDSVPSDLLTNTEGPSSVNIYKYSKIVLRKVTAGTFTMGTPTDELGRDSLETQHQVTLTKDYYVCVFEITQKQYELVFGSTPSTFTGSLRPVESVSWNEVRGGDWPSSSREPSTSSFVGLLQSKTGLSFDLPTEAEWEYACRAGTTKAYNNNTDALSETEVDANLEPLGWYRDNAFDQGTEHRNVGLKLANSFGLYDMHGNVWEWCLDLHQDDISADATDPEGSTTTTDRSIRGGAWGRDATHTRSGNRGGSGTTNNSANNNIGFRIILK